MRWTDRIQLTWWDKDSREKAGVSSGSGWAVSASYQLNEEFVPFTRFGHSDGGAGVAAESALSLGFEFQVQLDQTWSLGVGWARPSSKTHGPGLDDEYAVETSYNFQITPVISLMPDLQVLINPAMYPGRDRVWVAGVRALVSL